MARAQSRYSHFRLVDGSGRVRLGAVVFIQSMVVGADSDQSNRLVSALVSHQLYRGDTTKYTS